MDLITLIIFCIGLCLGSFLNVLIDRLPQGKSVLWGRSWCDHCHKTLRWFELVPVLSFLAQRGRCLRCRAHLSIQYPIVELLTSIGMVILYFFYSKSLNLYISSSIVFSALLVIFFADLKYQLIPDSMVIVGLVGSLGYVITSKISFLMIHLMTGLGSFVFFLFLWYLTRGRGMGLGDVKIAFLLGFLLGFPNIVVALYIAFLTGALVGVILILIGNKSFKTKIAFGPFLILGTTIALLWGSNIIKWWQGFI